MEQKLVLITVHAMDAYVLHTVCAEQAPPITHNGSVWHGLQLSESMEYKHLGYNGAKSLTGLHVITWDAG